MGEMWAMVEREIGAETIGPIWEMKAWNHDAPGECQRSTTLISEYWMMPSPVCREWRWMRLEHDVGDVAIYSWGARQSSSEVHWNRLGSYVVLELGFIDHFGRRG